MSITADNSPSERFVPVWARVTENVEGMSAAAAMEKAGLSGWNVRPVFVPIPDTDMHDYRMLIRDIPNKPGERVLVSEQLVKPSYIPIQNEEVFVGIVEMLAGTGLPIASAGTLGKMNNRAYICFDAGDVEMPGNERYKKYIFAVADHSGRAAVLLTPTAVRVVCVNTERMAIEEGVRSKTLIKIQHNTKDIDRFYNNTDSAREVLQLSHNYQLKLVQVAETLQSVPFSQEQYNIAVSIWRNKGLQIESGQEITERRRHIWSNRAAALKDAWNTEVLRAQSLGQEETTLWTARQAVSTWTQHTSGSKRRSASRSMALAMGEDVGMFDSMLYEIRNLVRSTDPKVTVENINMVLV